MSRGTVIAVSALGGFLAAFLVVQVYMWPEWHRDDCEDMECAAALAFSVFAGVLAGIAVMITAAFTAAGVTYWLAARSKAGESRFDHGP